MLFFFLFKWISRALQYYALQWAWPSTTMHSLQLLTHQIHFYFKLLPYSAKHFLHFVFFTTTFLSKYMTFQEYILIFPDLIGKMTNVARNWYIWLPIIFFLYWKIKHDNVNIYLWLVFGHLYNKSLQIIIRHSRILCRSLEGNNIFFKWKITFFLEKSSNLIFIRAMFWKENARK